MNSKVILHGFILLIICSALISGQNQHIISVYPNANLIGAERSTEISVQLDTELDSTSFPTRIFNIFGSNSGVVKGTSHYDKTNKKFTFTPDRKFFAGEVITVGFGQVNTSSGDILLAYHWQFTVKITKPTPPNFKPLVQYPIGAVFPFYCIDMDNDGSLDIISTNGNIIYNNGDGTFTRTTTNQGLLGFSFISDLNNDGYPDIIKTDNISLNDGNGNFTTTQSLPCFEIYAVGDVNGDNYDDLLALTHIINDTTRVFQFYLNDKSGHFNLDSNEIIVTGYIILVALVDVNKDGNLDAIFLDSPWFGRSSVEIYLNQGGGGLFNFMQRLSTGNGKPFHLYPSDYNNDGNIDYMIFGSSQGANFLFGSNSGMITLSNIESVCAELVGPANIGDYNGDNKIDYLFMSLLGPEAGDSAEIDFGIAFNSIVKPLSHFIESRLGYLFENVGGYPVPADLDNDGALDIILGNARVINVLINTDSTSGIKDKFGSPDFTLSQNYPNPFNPTTTISYSLPKSGNIKLTVYNILGSKVATIVDAYKPAGNYSVQFNGNNFASGIYLYRLESGNYSAAKKLILIK